MYKRQAQYDPSRKTARAIILVAFVHGWQNNADPDRQNNTQEFKAMLANLAEEERAKHQQDARKIVGVYIGWPGLSADVQPFQDASFYSRKNTGDRVGYYGGVTEVLSRLESLNDSIKMCIRDRERFTGWHAELANSYVSREMRKPYDYTFVS